MKAAFSKYGILFVILILLGLDTLFIDFIFVKEWINNGWALITIMVLLFINIFVIGVSITICSE